MHQLLTQQATLEAALLYSRRIYELKTALLRISSIYSTYTLSGAIFCMFRVTCVTSGPKCDAKDSFAWQVHLLFVFEPGRFSPNSTLQEISENIIEALI
jgi:hypothetical protein